MRPGCVWNRRRRRRAQRGIRLPQHQPPIRRSIRRACGSRFHGLQHGGPSRFSVNPACPNSGRFVLPTTIAPAPFIRSAGSESASAIRSLYSSEPIVWGIPATASVSLIGIGTPCSGPNSSPRITAASAARAASMAYSGARYRNACNFGSSSSIRLRHASVNSTGDTSRAATISARRHPGVNISSLSSWLIFLISSGAGPVAGAHQSLCTLNPPYRAVQFVISLAPDVLLTARVSFRAKPRNQSRRSAVVAPFLQLGPH